MIDSLKSLIGRNNTLTWGQIASYYSGRFHTRLLFSIQELIGTIRTRSEFNYGSQIKKKGLILTFLNQKKSKQCAEKNLIFGFEKIKNLEFLKNC